MELFRIREANEEWRYGTEPKFKIKSLKTQQIWVVVEKGYMIDAVAKTVKEYIYPFKTYSSIRRSIKWVGIEGKYEYYVYTD